MQSNARYAQNAYTSNRELGPNPAYSEAAIERQLKNVAETASGNGLRNKALNEAAFIIGRFVGAGEIPEEEAIDRLMRAAEANGYRQDHRYKATLNVIKHGLRAGQRQPYPVPRANGRRRLSLIPTTKVPQADQRASSGTRASSAISAPERTIPALPPIYLTPVGENAADKPQLPIRTKPNEKGKPRFEAGGNEGPPSWQSELRRHVYCSGGVTVRVKIKMQDGKFISWYRVNDCDGTEGWQCGKPEGYVDVPYLPKGLDPFDPELKDDILFWPEGEKDTDTLAKYGLPAFTFGGCGDGLPEGATKYLARRHIVVVADNDSAGQDHADAKASLASTVAASVKTVHFPELSAKQDVTDFFNRGGTAEELNRRVDETALWKAPAEESDAYAAYKTGHRPHSRLCQLGRN